MNEIGALGYVAGFVAALSLTWVLTPLALRYAARKSLLDVPGDHKSHDTPVPYLGGVAIILAFAVVVLVAAAVYSPPSGLPELALVLGFAALMSVMGLWDDLRGLNASVRLAVELGAGLALYLAGVGISLFGSDILNAAMTMLWVAGISNAFNLLDNMDGLSGGVAAIAAGSFFVIAAINGQFLVAALAIALAGCALGFLRHNFHPAKIYMGDAGSLFFGFMLAVIGMRLRFDGPTQITFFVPILVLGVAIFDTVLVVVGRLRHGRNPMLGGRDHMSHRLVYMGIPVRTTVNLIYGLAITLGWLGVIMSRLDQATGYLLMALVCSVGVFLSALLYAVPVYETSKRRRMMVLEVLPHESHNGAQTVEAGPDREQTGAKT